MFCIDFQIINSNRKIVNRHLGLIIFRFFCFFNNRTLCVDNCNRDQIFTFNHHVIFCKIWIDNSILIYI